ncbi:hypothetical protein BZG72_15710 [Salinivibrio sp. PR6]|uniref:hypothetical protein n=1 Tax=Salinivibrio sp. PR6 TaxID=1909485 RepID=UPI000988E0FD|nr:hypothetical protein [Salinivibrio sp. PR6]OOE78236.1 hypothetical protein BZG72_15710 [Salinivibrio sp. PR6]
MIRKKHKKPIKLITLDPCTGLERQPLFWLAVLLPVLFALGLATPVWLEYSPTLSAKGYDTFLKISALPIGISSLSIPLGVLIGRLHGTKQTALQISEAQATNRTNMFLSHCNYYREYFGERASYSIDLSNEYTVSFHCQHLYQNIYLGNGLSHGVKPPTPEPLLDIWRTVTTICQHLDNLTSGINNSTIKSQEIIDASKNLESEMIFTFKRAGFKLPDDYSLVKFHFKDIEKILTRVIEVTVIAKDFEPEFKRELENDILREAVKSVKKLKGDIMSKRREIANVESSLLSLSTITNQD